MKKESKIEVFRKDYLKLQKKYSLPSFRELNEDFGIEKASESETEIPIREIRRIISEKIYNYLRLVETFLNPMNAPMSIVSIVKNFGPEEKNRLTSMYKKLVNSEFQLISVDLEFSEKKEAEFIKNAHSMWREIKKDFIEIVDSTSKNGPAKKEAANRKYFG